MGEIHIYAIKYALPACLVQQEEGITQIFYFVIYVLDFHDERLEKYPQAKLSHEGMNHLLEQKS